MITDSGCKLSCGLRLSKMRTGDCKILQNAFLEKRKKRAQPRLGIGGLWTLWTVVVLEGVLAQRRDCGRGMQSGRLGGLESGN
jgi:hypothetical protein